MRPPSGIPRVLLVTCLAAAGVFAPHIVAPTLGAPTIAQLVGQKLMVAMAGTAPSSTLLGRVQRGEVGGVILFGSNVSTAAQVKALAAKLQQAATAGGQPPLLISTDQEGGSVKRVPWAPPSVSVPDMGATGSTTLAFDQGEAAGRVLGCAGINTNLAPVADVPSSTSSFMYQQGRTWSFSASTTAALSDAFASGLWAAGNVPAMKHFPGIGRATINTDTGVMTITASKATLAPELAPYQTAIGHGIPMIMLSNATYTAYDVANGAGWSKAIATDILRTQLGFEGVSITDSLSGTAAARGVSTLSLAIKTAAAGTDMILVTGTETASASLFTRLVDAATDGTIPLSALQASYARILALKSGLTPPALDTTAPTTSTPQIGLVAGVQTTRGTAPLRASWKATDRCAISQYAVKRRSADTAWTGQELSGPRAQSISQSLDLGDEHRYAARASDGAGNQGDWRYSRWFTPKLTQESGSAITYGGTWTHVANELAAGDRLAYSTANGASATFTFTGSSIGWVAYRGPSCGSARVYVDNVLEATVNLHAATSTARFVAFAKSWSSNGSHTIRIVNLGTAGHARVDVDAFIRVVLD